MAINTLDLLTRKTAVLKRIDESIVEKIIRHKWSSLHESLSKYTVVEDCGLGKFKIRNKVALKKLTQTLEKIDYWTKRFDEESDLRKKTTIGRRLESLQSDLEYIKTKIDEN